RGYSFHHSATQRRRHWPVTNEPFARPGWRGYNFGNFPISTLFPSFFNHPFPFVVVLYLSFNRNLHTSSYLELS
ncbi:hypothetical protein HOY82DRAFT_492022, partial [Tuber indicum]